MLVYLKEWFDIRILNHNRLKITPHVPLQYLFLKIIIFNLIITYYSGPRLFCDIYIYIYIYIYNSQLKEGYLHL